MFFENYILILIMILFFVFGLIGTAGWIREGEKLKKVKEENRKLGYENGRLRNRLRRIAALDNVKAADEYSKEENKDA